MKFSICVVASAKEFIAFINSVSLLHILSKTLENDDHLSTKD